MREVLGFDRGAAWVAKVVGLTLGIALSASKYSPVAKRLKLGFRTALAVWFLMGSQGRRLTTVEYFAARGLIGPCKDGLISGRAAFS